MKLTSVLGYHIRKKGEHVLSGQYGVIMGYKGLIESNNAGRLNLLL